MRFHPISWLVMGAASLGCSHSLVDAEVPAYEPRHESKCAVQKNQDHPLIVEWSPNDRAALESRLREGVVPVRYEGCEMEVLPRCTTDVDYDYHGVTRETERVAIDNADALYANLPFGAAGLEGKLERSGRLDVTMTIAGRYEAEQTTIERDDLEGAECAAATHAVIAINVGAYELTAGGSTGAGIGAEVGDNDAGVRSHSRREELKRGGDMSSCDAASRGDDEPPEGCGALLRLELVPIGEIRQAEPECPAGSRWTGSQCDRVRPSPSVPSDDSDDGPGLGTALATIGGVVGAAGIVASIVWAASRNGDEPDELPPAEQQPAAAQLGTWSF
jgi:hypothetical protein